MNYWTSASNVFFISGYSSSERTGSLKQAGNTCKKLEMSGEAEQSGFPETPFPILLRKDLLYSPQGPGHRMATCRKRATGFWALTGFLQRFCFPQKSPTELFLPECPEIRILSPNRCNKSCPQCFSFQLFSTQCLWKPGILIPPSSLLWCQIVPCGNFFSSTSFQNF